MFDGAFSSSGLIYPKGKEKLLLLTLQRYLNSVYLLCGLRADRSGHKKGYRGVSRRLTAHPRITDPGGLYVYHSQTGAAAALPL